MLYFYGRCIIDILYLFNSKDVSFDNTYFLKKILPIKDKTQNFFLFLSLDFPPYKESESNSFDNSIML